MSKNLIRFKSLNEPAFIIFIITSSAYALNYIYETCRLWSYSVSPALTEVKLQNFLITGAVLGICLGVIIQTRQLAFSRIEKKVTNESAVQYTKRLATMIIVSLMMIMDLLLITILPPYKNDTLSQWFWVVGVASLLFLIGFIISLALKAQRKNMSYSKYIKKHVNTPYKENARDAIDNNGVIYVGSVLFSVILIAALGSMASSDTKDAYVLTSSSKNMKHVIVGTYADNYIIKVFNTKTRSYQPEYELVEIKNQQVLHQEEL